MLIHIISNQPEAYYLFKMLEMFSNFSLTTQNAPVTFWLIDSQRKPAPYHNSP